MSSLTLVSMNTKILLGLTLIAVLAMTVTSPAIADAVTGIKKTEIKVKHGEIDKLKFHLDDKVEKPTFGGYAIFTTDGAVVAFTQHAGVYDSTSQTAPTSDQIDIQVGAIAAVCNVDDVACGDEWHSHLVVPDVDNSYCNFAAISELTFNEPANKVKAGGKHVEGKDIALGDSGFVGAISGELDTWTVGAPLEGGAAFDLNPAFVDGNLVAICIGDVDANTTGLCTDIAAAGSGQDYKLAVGAGGDNNKVELSEFLYGEDLFDSINTNTGDVTPEGLGGVELQTWFDTTC